MVKDTAYLVAWRAFLLAGVTAAFVLLSWQMRIRLGTSIVGGTRPMAPSTAVAFLLLSLSGGIVLRTPRAALRRAAVLLSAMVAGAAFLRLVTAFTGFSNAEPFFASSGRAMSLLTATALLGEACAFALLARAGTRRRALAAALATAGLLTGVIVVLGYAYRRPFVDASSAIPAALSSGFCMVILAVGALAVLGFEVWPLSAFHGEDLYPRLMRRFMPIIAALTATWTLIVGLIYARAANPALLVATLVMLPLGLTTLMLARITRIIDTDLKVAGETSLGAFGREKMAQARAETLLQAQKKKEQLTQLIVHDLKNPLASIVLNADFASQDANASEETREALRDVVNGSQALHRMVLNLLDVSRGEDGVLVPKRMPCDLVAIIKRAASEMTQRAQMRAQRFEFHADPAAIEFSADPDLFRRVVENLLDNSMKYGPSDSAIEIDIAANPQGVELRIRDEGPGIPKSDQERIFEKYARLDSQVDLARTSYGLGLLFCRMAIEAHGGTIAIETTEPRGSVFVVRLPPEKQQAYDKDTIMVIDDDADIREALTGILIDEGYNVISFGNAFEAMTHLQNSPPPLLILLDLMMPVMNGWEFLERYRRDPELAHIPVILLSADEHVAHTARAMQLTDFLKKPISADRLLDIIRQRCDDARARLAVNATAELSLAPH